MSLLSATCLARGYCRDHLCDLSFHVVILIYIVTALLINLLPVVNCASCLLFVNRPAAGLNLPSNRCAIRYRTCRAKVTAAPLMRPLPVRLAAHCRDVMTVDKGRGRGSPGSRTVTHTLSLSLAAPAGILVVLGTASM